MYKITRCKLREVKIIKMLYCCLQHRYTIPKQPITMIPNDQIMIICFTQRSSKKASLVLKWLDNDTYQNFLKIKQNTDDAS